MKKVIDFSKIDIRKYDFHVHSNYTDGESSIEENVQEAIRKGLEGIAITEHVRRESSWIREYLKEIEICRDKYPNIKIHVGFETKIVDLSGNLDILPEIITKVDVILGAIHRLPISLEEYKFADLDRLADEEIVHFYEKALIALISNQFVDIIAHPFHILKKKGLHLEEYGKKRVFKALKRYNKVVEINAKYKVPDKNFIELCVRNGIKLCQGSDAHNAKEILNSIQFNDKILSQTTTEHNSGDRRDDYALQ